MYNGHIFKRLLAFPDLAHTELRIVYIGIVACGVRYLYDILYNTTTAFIQVQ